MVNIEHQSYNFVFKKNTVDSIKLEKKTADTSAAGTETLKRTLLSSFRIDTMHNTGKSIMDQFGELDRALKNLNTDHTDIENFDPSSLSREEAMSLVSKDGYFGVDKTSKRIADFVIKGAGSDLEKLRAGREGVLKGFKEAEKSYGSSLPEISHETIRAAVELIDESIKEAGGSVLDVSA